MELLKKTLSFITVFLLIFYQVYFPLAVLAQEATPSASVEQVSEPTSEPSPSETPTPTPEPSPSPTPSPQPTPAPLWTESDGAYTTQTLQTGITYKFPPNEKVSLTFTKLPEGSGTVTVKEVSALGTTAYDITSTMTDGTFEYTLTLPTSTTENVEVKASEDGQTFVTLGGVSPGDSILTITGLNHFTVFVVVGTISGSTATPFEDSVNPDVLINEFMFNPASGNDWVELYNQGQGDLGVNVDLTGWTLVDNTSTMIALSGTLSPGAFLAFDVSNRLNAASPSGDKIELRNAEGEIVDQVSYKDSTNINGGQNVGNVDAGQSVGRVVNQGNTWDVFLIPTKGSANNSTVYVNGSYSSDTDEYFGTFNRPFTSIQSGIDAVAADGTVNVAAGDYYENLVIAQSLTLSGAGVGQSTIFDSYCGDSVIISIDASNVTIQNFALNGDGCGATVVSLANGVSGITIQNNEIINGNSAVETSGQVSSIQILNNSIYDNDSFGIRVSSGTETAFYNNKIYNNGVGVENQDPGNFVDASFNFWGHESGPTSEANSDGQGDQIVGNVNFWPFYVDNDLTTFSEVPAGDFNDLIDNFFDSGIFDLPEGEDISSTLQFEVTEELTITISDEGFLETVLLPPGTIVTATDGFEIDASLLDAQDISEALLSGFSTSEVVEGALQWGIPGEELSFSNPVTLVISVGTEFNGQTLTVKRSTSGSGGWTDVGIVAPGTCVVTDGLCTFQATLASYFATTRTVATSSSSSSSTQALSPAGGGGTPPVCNDAKPGGAPTLISAIAGTNSVTLNWNKAINPVTYYLATYGLAPGQQQYGNPNIGGPDTTSYTVSGLSGGTAYYFKVRAGNGCTPGDFSNEVSATPEGGVVSGPATGFAPGVLGEQTTIEDVGIGKIGQVQGEVTQSAQISPSPESQEVESAPFDAKVLLIVAVTLLFGFGVFKLIVK